METADRARTGVLIVLVAQLMLVLDATVVNVALPRIDADLGFGPASLSWVLNAYTLAFGGLLLLGGRLGDVLGRLRVFEAGLAVFVLASLLGGLAPSSGLLVAARALQGVGAALAAPSVLALLTTSARDEAERHRALALFGAVSSGGASIGLLLGGVLTDIGSWRWAMFINVPIGLAVLALAPLFVTETVRRPGRFDVVGAVTATVGAVSIVWALIGTPDHGWVSARTLGGFALGLLSLALLAFTERRVEHPMIQPALLANRTRVAALAMMALVVGAQLSMFFLVVQYVQNVLGFGPLASGFAFLPFSLGIILTAGLVSQLLPRVGPRALMLPGLVMAVVGMLLLTRIEQDSSYWALVFPAMVLMSVGLAGVFIPAASTSLVGVESHDAGVASAVLNTSQQIGGSLGTALLNTLFAGAVTAYFVDNPPTGREQAQQILPFAFIHGYHVAFFWGAVLFAGALLVSALLINAHREDIPADAAVVADPAG